MDAPLRTWGDHEAEEGAVVELEVVVRRGQDFVGADVVATSRAILDEMPRPLARAASRLLRVCRPDLQEVLGLALWSLHDGATITHIMRLMCKYPGEES